VVASDVPSRDTGAIATVDQSLALSYWPRWPRRVPRTCEEVEQSPTHVGISLAILIKLFSFAVDVYALAASMTERWPPVLG